LDRFPWRSWREGLKSKRKGGIEHKIAGNPIPRLEFRRDISNQPSFLKGNLPVSGQNTMAGGLIFVFDSQETK